MLKFKLLICFLFLLIATVSMGSITRCGEWRGCKFYQQYKDDLTSVVLEKMPPHFKIKCTLSTINPNPYFGTLTYETWLGIGLTVIPPVHKTGGVVGPMYIQNYTSMENAIQIFIHINSRGASSGQIACSEGPHIDR